MFTDLKLFNLHVDAGSGASPLTRSVGYTRAITLNYSQNLFSVEFAALEYTSPGNNKYEYRLEGFNNNWVRAGATREAVFTNLDPGTYRLRVRAANSDGIWSREEAVLGVTILPPFYMTAWFKILAVAFLLAASALSARYVILRRLREQIIRSEHEAAIERERLRIARDLHDEIGSRLTEIRMISEIVKQKDSSEANIAAELDEISTASENLVAIFSEIVWSLNPQNDKLENLASFLGQCATDFLRKADIRCRLEIPENLPDHDISSDIRHNLIMAVKESINNVVKHAAASLVHISLKLEKSVLIVVIKDDGRGFDINHINEFGNGLRNMQRRIENIGGELELKSSAGSGTTETIRLPLTGLKPN